METHWKLQSTGNSASRTNADGQFEYSIDPAVLATALPADPVPLQPLKDAAIAKTYADIDAIYYAAVGGRTEEYKDAERDARAFKASGYSGIPTGYVTGFAVKSGLTNIQAADVIIARADAFAVAKLAMRDTRFDAKNAILSSADKAALDSAMATWDAFIVSTRAALGLK